MMIIADPLPVDPDCEPGPAPADAEALAHIASNPDVDSTALMAVRVGGIDALRMDVAFGPGAGCGELGIGPAVVEGFQHLHGSESRMRLYLLDLPEVMSALVLGIALAASEEGFGRWLRRRRQPWTCSSSTPGDADAPIQQDRAFEEIALLRETPRSRPPCRIARKPSPSPGGS
jgi:hypothetical protein